MTAKPPTREQVARAAGVLGLSLDSADLEAWLEEYSLGQLWEKNELGGRPASA